MNKTIKNTKCIILIILITLLTSCKKQSVKQDTDNSKRSQDINVSVEKTTADDCGNNYGLRDTEKCLVKLSSKGDKEATNKLSRAISSEVYKSQYMSYMFWLGLINYGNKSNLDILNDLGSEQIDGLASAETKYGLLLRLVKSYDLTEDKRPTKILYTELLLLSYFEAKDRIDDLAFYIEDAKALDDEFVLDFYLLSLKLRIDNIALITKNELLRRNNIEAVFLAKEKNIEIDYAEAEKSLKDTSDISSRYRRFLAESAENGSLLAKERVIKLNLVEDQNTRERYLGDIKSSGDLLAIYQLKTELGLSGCKALSEHKISKEYSESTLSATIDGATVYEKSFGDYICGLANNSNIKVTNIKLNSATAQIHINSESGIPVKITLQRNYRGLWQLQSVFKQGKVVTLNDYEKYAFLTQSTK